MRKILWRAFMLMACLLLAAPYPAAAMGGYKDLLWIDIHGTVLHRLEDGTFTLNSFARYREVRYEDSTRKPGHFVCFHEGIAKEIPVRDIKSIKLRLSAEQYAKSPRADRLKLLVLTMKDGQSINVEVQENMGYSLANDTAIQFKYYDPIQKKFTFGSLYSADLRELRFE